jgi:hypothetical protein
MNLEELRKVTSELKNNFGTLIELNKGVLNQLPPEAEAVKLKAIKDLESLPNLVKNKDVESITALFKDYADKNNK